MGGNELTLSVKLEIHSKVLELVLLQKLDKFFDTHDGYFTCTKIIHSSHTSLIWTNYREAGMDSSI